MVSPRVFLQFLFIISLTVQIPAQEGSGFTGIEDDMLFNRARDLGYSGELEGAREAASVLLERNPLYHDAYVLMARLYAWEREFDPARNYLDGVFALENCYHDALSISIDLEIWEGNFEMAITKADKALLCHPDDEVFLFKKANTYFLMGNNQEANEILDYLLEINPGNEDANELKRQMSSPGVYYYRENNYLLAGYHGEFLQEPFSRRMHIGTIGYSHYTRRGPVTGKLNFANTYIDGTGLTRYPSLQYEAESYPRLSPESYLFLNYAFSSGTVFPRHRGAFEYFRDLPHGFEASLGMRFLHWNRTYLFYTGSAGKYYSDLWFSLRTYLFPGDDGVAASWYFNGRKYFRTADDYAGIIAGIGFSPDETLSELTGRLYLRSFNTGIEFSRGIGEGYLVRGSLLYGHEEYFNDSWRGRLTVNIGLRYYL